MVRFNRSGATNTFLQTRHEKSTQLYHNDYVFAHYPVAATYPPAMPIRAS